MDDVLLLTHGAGSNCDAPVLVAVAKAFEEVGLRVVRFNLPFREARTGPPRPGDAGKDREGIRRAVALARATGPGRLFLGGQSYGGRQATIAASEDPSLADGLLLLSYPLHPPGRPAQLRTAHFPALRTPALFVHGTRDTFGSIDEMREATKLIPARIDLLTIDSGGHDLGPLKRGAARVVTAFQEFFRQA